METKIGSTKFLRLTGADNFRVRLMECAGVIAPERTDTGWRIFTDADVEAAKGMDGGERQAAPFRRDRRVKMLTQLMFGADICNSKPYGYAPRSRLPLRE